jgi:hypothetical protein
VNPDMGAEYGKHERNEKETDLSDLSDGYRIIICAINFR